MSVKLKIPKGTQVTMKQIDWKGRKQDITCFSATSEDGSTLYANCEAWGDRKAQIEEVIGTDKALEADSIEFQQQYNKYQVKFPRGSGGEANFRGRWQGGGNDKGYRGQPVSLDRFKSITDDLFAHFFGVVKKALGAEVMKEVPVDATKLCAEEARSLVATYWMSVRDNITFPEGCEPKAQPAESAGGGATGSEKPAPSGDPVAAFRARIAAVTSVAESDALNEEIMKADMNAGQRAELFTELYQKTKPLKAQGA